MYTYYTTNLKWSGSSGGDDESTRSSGVHGAAVLDHSQNVSDFGRSISFSSWPDYCVLPKPVQVLLTDTYGAWVLLVYFDVDSQTLLGVGVSHCEWQVSRLWQLYLSESLIWAHTTEHKRKLPKRRRSLLGQVRFILFYFIHSFYLSLNPTYFYGTTIRRETPKKDGPKTSSVFLYCLIHLNIFRY